ncbi:MAG: phosphatase PAP2 family protein [Acidobacteria bacterium]|nr:phosphatase PAP2 family protein [Acidobacteriota bacterium]
MRIYEWIGVGFFLAYVVLAWTRRLDARRRTTATAFGIVGAASLLLASFESGAARDWLPALLLPVAYWQTGQFARPIHQALQNRLWQFDQKILQRLAALRGSSILHWTKSALELAYLLCYPFVPCGFAVLYLSGFREHSTQFWNVVLPAAYACYGTFPFFQTLPPRALEEPMVSSGKGIRALNLAVLRRLSVQANTFPSGHVAASLSVALVLVQHMPYAGAIFLGFALGIAGGAFVGRYHYALDVFIGAALALLSFAGMMWTQ